MNKEYCTTHHFYYSSVECPFCLQDRISKTSKIKPVRYDKMDEQTLNEKLEQLKEKFNKQ